MRFDEGDGGEFEVGVGADIVDCAGGGCVS